MSKSLIYTANSNAQTVAVGNVANFGNTIRRYGCNCQNNSTALVANGCGYYDIDVNTTFTATAGTVTLSLYKDGAPIPGATASVTAAADTTYTITIPTAIRVKCCDSLITLVVSGVPVNFTNIAARMVKD